MSRLIDADALWMDIIHSMDYCDDFLSFIDAAPTVPQWIPCSERLPDISKSVLICDIDGDIYLGHRTRFGDYYQDIGDHRIKNVTAWMPLPEPYKEGNK